jgi:hypothetical protein
MLNKYILKSGSDNLSLRINLSSRFSDVEQKFNLDDYINSSSVDLINETPDLEMRRFKYESSGITLNFQFIVNPFTNIEISGNSLSVLNSFYIMEIYNNYDINNIKLSTSYLTKNFNNIYTINQSVLQELNYLYLPISYIDEQINNSFTIYSRFLFYNAKNSKTSVFYNQYANADSNEYTYFKILIDKINKTWSFNQVSNNMYINQIDDSNSLFIQKINNNINNFNNLKQLYPSGQTFNYQTQSYFNISGLTSTNY